jgi:hypothetical protein
MIRPSTPEEVAAVEAICSHYAPRFEGAHDIWSGYGPPARLTNLFAPRLTVEPKNVSGNGWRIRLSEYVSYPTTWAENDAAEARILPELATVMEHLR